MNTCLNTLSGIMRGYRNEKAPLPAFEMPRHWWGTDFMHKGPKHSLEFSLFLLKLSPHSPAFWKVGVTQGWILAKEFDWPWGAPPSGLAMVGAPFCGHSNRHKLSCLLFPPRLAGVGMTHKVLQRAQPGCVEENGSAVQFTCPGLSCEQEINIHCVWAIMCF